MKQIQLSKMIKFIISKKFINEKLNLIINQRKNLFNNKIIRNDNTKNSESSSLIKNFKKEKNLKI